MESRAKEDEFRFHLPHPSFLPSSDVVLVCRAEAAENFTKGLKKWADLAESKEEKYAHITAEERKGVTDCCSAAQTWLTKQLETQVFIFLTLPFVDHAFVFQTLLLRFPGRDAQAC